LRRLLELIERKTRRRRPAAGRGLRWW